MSDARTDEQTAREGHAIRSTGGTWRPRLKSGGKPKAKAGLAIERYFTRANEDPFAAVEWELRDAKIGSETGDVIFEQTGVEIPKSWSQLATNVVVSKYFRGHVGTPEREHSVKQLIGRVVGRLREWGDASGYFKTAADSEAFRDELTHVLVTQRACFNSPVWFNLGVPETPQQASACFINAVDDTMESIMDLAKTEAMLFKGGSGAGSNLSAIRSSRERLSGGGIASGPVSFMKGLDTFAGAIKSGGKTRRAAKMVILNADHPDVLDFIRSKQEEEKKAAALIDAGYDGGFNVPGGAYDSVHFQNANHSVRVTDEFMRSVIEDREWKTRSVMTGAPIDTMKARDLLHEMADAAHGCGDPGIQYDTTINRWHPCKESGRINASNPCSEYMFLDDTACNLASLNLMRFADDEGNFDVEAFRRTVHIVFLAQEIIIDHADYPTARIAWNSHLYRPIGLGYANLGALLMADGVAYDSDEGRNVAAAITALMSGQSYLTSAKIAAAMGPFTHYAKNRDAFLEVIGMHKAAADAIASPGVQGDLLAAARDSWSEALRLGRRHGYKNAQATVLAPTGTIAFMMDCDTTGVEPDIALVKYKKLVGGGMLKIVNQTVPMALRRLGYDPAQIDAIIQFIDEQETIEGAPELRDDHLSVFDCAFRAEKGKRSIHWMGHVRMMGAVQPFLSGAISKTVNLPADATVEDVKTAYIEGWRLGLKALAVYRDGCKQSQPLNTSNRTSPQNQESGAKVISLEEVRPRRVKLPDERRAWTHKFTIAGHEGYLTVGVYDDGSPGEIFLKMAKEGSTVSGLMDTIATMTSISLQYGVPLKALVDKFSHTRFEPSGFTNNREIPFAKSIADYVFRYLGGRFLQEEVPVADEQETDAETAGLTPPRPMLRAAVAGGSGTALPRVANHAPQAFVNQSDAPSCSECGSIMVRNGACYKCANCGGTSGCS